MSPTVTDKSSDLSRLRSMPLSAKNEGKLENVFSANTDKQSKTGVKQPLKGKMGLGKTIEKAKTLNSRNTIGAVGGQKAMNTTS